MIRCKLSAILGDRRIKLRELERRTGIAHSTLISLYHERAKGVSFRVLDRICEALGVTPGDLLKWEPNPNHDKERSGRE